MVRKVKKGMEKEKIIKIVRPKSQLVGTYVKIVELPYWEHNRNGDKGIQEGKIKTRVNDDIKEGGSYE